MDFSFELIGGSQFLVVTHMIGKICDVNIEPIVQAVDNNLLVRIIAWAKMGCLAVNGKDRKSVV